MSISKEDVTTRLKLMILTAAVGGVGGFISGVISYDQKFSLGTLIGFGFAAGFSIDTLVSRFTKATVG